LINICCRHRLSAANPLAAVAAVDLWGSWTEFVHFINPAPYTARAASDTMQAGRPVLPDPEHTARGDTWPDLRCFDLKKSHVRAIGSNFFAAPKI